MKVDSADKLVKISSIIHNIYGSELHKKRQLSIAYAAMLSYPAYRAAQLEPLASLRSE